MIVVLSRSDKITTIILFQALSPIAILVNVLIALFFYFENVRKNKSGETRRKPGSYLNEAKQLLERSYKVFIKEEGEPPSNANMNWCTASLLISKSVDLEKKITEPDQKVAFDGHKQYFAVRFHKVLWSNVGQMDLNYFISLGNPNDTKTIPRKTITVIFQFVHSISNNYKKLVDIDSAPIMASSVPPDFLGVENLIGQYQGLRERVHEIRKNN